MRPLLYKTSHALSIPVGPMFLYPLYTLTVKNEFPGEQDAPAGHSRGELDVERKVTL